MYTSSPLLTIVEQPSVCLADVTSTLMLGCIADRGWISVAALCLARILTECLRLCTHLCAARACGQSTMLLCCLRVTQRGTADAAIGLLGMTHGLLFAGQLQATHAATFHMSIVQRTLQIHFTTVSTLFILCPQIGRQFYFGSQYPWERSCRLHQQLHIGAVLATETWYRRLHNVRQSSNVIGQSTPVLPQRDLQLFGVEHLSHLFQRVDVLEVAFHGEAVVAEHGKPGFHGTGAKIVSQCFNCRLQIAVGAQPNTRTGDLQERNR